MNWPIQRHQLKHQQSLSDQLIRIAVHTALPTGDHSGRSRHQDDDLTFVRQIFPVARSGPAIVAADDAAWQSGVRPGMPLAEARSMATPVTNKGSTSSTLSETTFVEWAPADDRKSLKGIAELVRRFAPIIGLDETPCPDSLLLDITGCAPLFGGEASLAEQLVARLRQHKLSCRVAISDSVATAWAFAHVRGHWLQAATQTRSRRGHRNRIPDSGHSEWDLPVVIIPPGQAQTWLERLPIAAARIPLADADVLFQLGILTLRQLFHLPFEDLPSRISEQAIRRLKQIRGIEDELINSIPEADPVVAVWVSEFPATSTNEIRRVLEYLTNDIAEQLHRRNLGAVRLVCRLKSESGESTALTAEVVKPVQSAVEMAEVLSLRLESCPVLPTLSVTMRATVAPLPIARQQDLFSPTEHLEPAEELATVVNRISNRLGTQSVLTAGFTSDPVPENSVELRSVIDGNAEAGRSIDDRLNSLVTPETTANRCEATQDLPLRMLADAVHLGDRASQPMQNGFCWNLNVYKVVSATGPDRLQTHWWQDVAVHRDYYRVQTQCGSLFWIYQTLQTGAWYLHGIFD